ncbi:Hydroxylase [Kitasatospora sp. MMS16-BH015]|uniref:VOC family protein n=1 Tax=Kitasatospora sp. MMS16-BH015 TaxID=2018025 RepID=UPI000CA1DD39|nr:VOC family protein [Kitasatospora sp. MMS16-BH015]AUG76328.1 Hydroxylase [Kitasatospora sp. MMS16-BH015]
MTTIEYRAGQPSWIDLGCPDVPAGTAFYRAVFGWDFLSAGPEAGGYGMFQQDGRTVAAIGGLEEGATSAWTVYFQTPDADAVAKAVEQAGGTVRLAPFDVMDAGRMGQFTDPTGGEFAIWQPGRTVGLDQTGAPGSLCWAELHTADPAAALAFYRAVFGWRSADSGVPGVEYTVLSTATGEQPEAGFGGLAGLHEALRPGWLVHFTVTDVDATAAATTTAGGSIVMPPADVPTVGRIAVFADPFGAQYAVISPLPREA